MIAKILMAETPNIEKTAFSRKVRRVFGIDLHSWEQLMLLSLGVAGLVATAVFVTTASVVILQRHEATEARLAVAKLEKEAEELRAKNLLFEKAVSPRKLEQALTGKQLSEFSDMRVLVASPSELEPKRAAGEIRYMLLQEAGWKRFVGNFNSSTFSDGVVVSGTTAGISTERTVAAVEKLVSVLNENGIEARQGPPLPIMEKGIVLVEVGLEHFPFRLPIPRIGEICGAF